MADFEDKPLRKTLSVTIEYEKNQERSLYRLKKKNTLHIVVAENLLGKHVAILTNYPMDDKAPFVRGKEFLNLILTRASLEGHFIPPTDFETCQINIRRIKLQIQVPYPLQFTQFIIS